MPRRAKVIGRVLQRLLNLVQLRVKPDELVHAGRDLIRVEWQRDEVVGVGLGDANAIATVVVGGHHHHRKRRIMRPYSRRVERR